MHKPTHRTTHRPHHISTNTNPHTEHVTYLQTQTLTQTTSHIYKHKPSHRTRPISTNTNPHTEHVTYLHAQTHVLQSTCTNHTLTFHDKSNNLPQWTTKDQKKPTCSDTRLSPSVSILVAVPTSTRATKQTSSPSAAFCSELCNQATPYLMTCARLRHHPHLPHQYMYHKANIFPSTTSHSLSWVPQSDNFLFYDLISTGYVMALLQVLTGKYIKLPDKCICQEAYSLPSIHFPCCH